MCVYFIITSSTCKKCSSSTVHWRATDSIHFDYVHVYTISIFHYVYFRHLKKEKIANAQALYDLFYLPQTTLQVMYLLITNQRACRTACCYDLIASLFGVSNVLLYFHYILAMNPIAVDIMYVKHLFNSYYYWSYWFTFSELPGPENLSTFKVFHIYIPTWVLQWSRTLG